MKSNFKVRTLLALAAWLLLQNFNFKPVDGGRFTVDGRSSAGGKCTDSGRADKQETLNLSFDIPLSPNNHPPSTVDRRPSTVHRPPSAAYRIKKIVLDAGHGGKDPGCSGAASKEKDNALAIVLKLGAYIASAYPEIEVIYTRDSDVFIELNERAAIANRNAADLFVSVHCNSMPVSRVTGTETYVLGVNRAEHNLEVAKRENAVISLEKDYEQNYGGYDPNSSEAHILSSVWQSAYLEQSILFAKLVQENAKNLAAREDKGVKQAGFLVLRETAMPSVLVEAGYMTNRTEEEFLASDEGQTQMAEVIFRAFESYKNQMEGGPVIVTKPVSQPGKPVVSLQAKKNAALTNNPPVKTVSMPNNPPKTAQTSPKVQSNTNKTNVSPANAFRIFLLSWPSRLDRNVGQLSLISDVNEEQHDGKFHYFTGPYSSLTEADKMLSEIKNLGFKTASIVSVTH